jgi:cation diffusion facilitator family transporter
MSEVPKAAVAHSHIFLGAGHERSEQRTWLVIALCGLVMVAEIGVGLVSGSIALVADGLHMSTHAGALLIAALAYSYARRHAADPRFAFGTGKLGDLAGFTSAVVLAMIALLIGYESVERLVNPIAIDVGQAMPIALLGLVVNLASAWLLSGGAHHHHGDRHDHDHDHDHHDHGHGNHDHPVEAHRAEALEAHLHAHVTHRDNNFRAAFVHVVADAAVSVLVIVGLIAARHFGWVWIDPAVGIVGALVIANWSWGLIRDTGAILLDMNADREMAEDMRKAIESDGDRLVDLHLWRLGPGHLGAIVSVVTSASRRCDFYRAKLARFRNLSHLTIEIEPQSSP